MKLVLKLSMNNVAFEDNESHEAARILRALADRLNGHPHFSPGHDCPLYDINGNEVGFASVAEDDSTWQM